MDWGQYDQEGAMRQRYSQIDERAEDARQSIARRRGGWDELQQLYDISWLYHENALEGVVLTYPEIKSAVDNNIISDVSLLPTYRVIKNQKYCLDVMRDKAVQKRFCLSADFLIELHAKLSQGHSEVALWRKDIPIHRTYFHDIVVPHKVQEILDGLLHYIKNTSDGETHPVELAANVHHRFMHCFPFTVFSGILGRLILNFVLIRRGYLPVVIHASERQRYYEALQGSERDFRPFVAEALENSLENAQRFFRMQAQQSVPRAASAL